MSNWAFIKHLYDEVRAAYPQKGLFEVLTDLEGVVERLVKLAGSLDAAAATSAAPTPAA